MSLPALIGGAVSIAAFSPRNVVPAQHLTSRWCCAPSATRAARRSPRPPAERPLAELLGFAGVTLPPSRNRDGVV